MGIPLPPEQLAKDCQAGRPRPVYYLFGEDAAARAAAVARLKELLKPDPFNLNEVDAEAAQEAVSAANTPPVFSDRRLVLVRGTRVPAEARRSLAEYLKDPLASTTLVLQSDDAKPDLRDALAAAAAAKDGIVVFAPLKPEAAAERLVAEARHAGVSLAAEAAQRIVEEAGTNWGILKTELEKLLLFAKGRRELSADDALACLGYRRAANPFELPKLVLSRRRTAALELVGRLLEEGVSEFQLLPGLVRELNRVLKARRMRAAGMSSAQIAGALRLHPYHDRDFLRKAEAASEARLVKSLKACLETEAALKSKSWLDPRIELERLVSRLSG